MDFQERANELISQLNALDEEHGDSNVIMCLMDDLISDGIIESDGVGNYIYNGEEYDNKMDLLENNTELYEYYVPLLEDYINDYFPDENNESWLSELNQTVLNEVNLAWPQGRTG